MRLTFTSIVGSILMLLGVGAIVAYYFIHQYAQIGAGMMAKQMCSCLYVQNRDENECRAEMNKSMGNIASKMKVVYFTRTLNARFDNKDGSSEIASAGFPDSVLVSFYGIAMTQAKLQPGFGCSVTKFEGQMPNGLNNVTP